MGSIARVTVQYTDLDVFLAEQSLPVYGAFMGGTSMYGQPLPKKGILVLGNEANGISTTIADRITSKNRYTPVWGTTNGKPQCSYSCRYFTI